MREPNGKSRESDLKGSYFYISTFQHLDDSYFEDNDRNRYFEIYWARDEKFLRFNDHDETEGDWMYLIPPFRNYHFKLANRNKKGILIAFDKDLLIYEAKEFSLSVFKFFSREGDFSTIHIDEQTGKSLTAISNIITEEYLLNTDNILLLRTLIKAFLLKLMDNSSQQLVSPGINEKRIYRFLMLLENHYITEKSVGFYAGKLNLSTKRLNQILKQKIDKTIHQMLQERLLAEAKHLLFVGKMNIKEISFSLGFEDPSYFSRFFRKMTKSSPEEFKEAIRVRIQ